MDEIPVEWPSPGRDSRPLRPVLGGSAPARRATGRRPRRRPASQPAVVSLKK